MGIFNDDRASFNTTASDFDSELSQEVLDSALRKAFDAGMNIDEIMYIVFSHTERVVRRYIVQDQLKKVAQKDKE